jgi:hypothetical protein
MGGWWWPVGFLFLASAAEGFLFKLHKAGTLDALERWRQRPRAVVITATEIALLLTAAGLFTTTSGWAATGWSVAGFIVAAMLAWTTHLILKAPAPRTPEPELTATEPEPKPTPAELAELLDKGKFLEKLAYIWARSPGQQWPMHAVPMTNGVPEPRAYCGSEYEADRSGRGSLFWRWDTDYRRFTCKTCKVRILGVDQVKRMSGR